MRVMKTCLCLAASALMLVPVSAMARQLAVAKVTPVGVACIFSPRCGITPTDSLHSIDLFGNGGHGKLLVRTYPGLPGTRAAGLTGYSFFINMAGATSLGMANCVQKLTLDTGPVTAINYDGGAEADVFVVGGAGGADISSVSQTGSKLTFTFAKPICPGRLGMSESLYFGFAAKNAPAPGRGQVTGSLQGVADIDVRVPKHSGPNS